MEANSTQVIMALGCNIGGEENMRRAQQMLKDVVDGIVFTSSIWTEPIGIESADFLNCLAMAHTAMDYPSLHARLKQIEATFGATAGEKRAGKVAMDIDILQMGDERYHEADWSRPYIQALLRQLL